MVESFREDLQFDGAELAQVCRRPKSQNRIIGPARLSDSLYRYWEFLLGARFGSSDTTAFLILSIVLWASLYGARRKRCLHRLGLFASCLVVGFFPFLPVSLEQGKNDRYKKPSRIVFKSASLISVGLVVVLFAWPNDHARGYHSHVVYPVKTIEVLEELNQASDPDDFVVTWWDYGSGCWFYGDTRTFTSPAHQTLDNYLTSEILRANSHLQAAHLARLKTETLVRLQDEKKKSGETTYDTAVQEIFKDGSSDLVFYQGLLEEMNDANASLPSKSRDVFLFMPYEILRIFPTILSFSSRNLYFPSSSVNSRKELPMKILRNGRRQGNSLFFEGGHRMDRTGVLKIMDAEKSFVLPYGKMLTVSEDGQPAETVEQVEVDGLAHSGEHKQGS